MDYTTQIKQDIRYKKNDRAYFLSLRGSESNAVQMKIMDRKVKEMKTL